MTYVKKIRFKINDDTMTTIVISSLLFCVGVVIASFIFLAYDKDASALVQYTLPVFGTELGICGVLTMHKRWQDKEDERAASRQESRMKREMNNENTKG